MFKTIIAIIVVTIVVLVALAGVDRLTGDIVEGSSNVTSANSSSLTGLSVTISGEINRPGTYLVEKGDTLADLVTYSGGLTGNDDDRCYNLNFVLENKQSFYIAPLRDNSSACAAETIAKVCLNSATKDELDEGVDAFSNSVAQAIVDYRDTNGSFLRLEELKEVTGIGPATFEKCKDYVTLR